MSHPTSPRPPDVSRGPMLLAVTSTLFALAFFIYLARMYTRIRPVLNLGWDDGAISLAMAGAFALSGMTIALVAHGLGRHSYYVSPSNAVKVNFLAFIGAPVWLWNTTMIKISVALSLLRIKNTRAWKLWMKFIIATQVVIAVIATITQLIRCRPIRAAWDPSILDAKCWSLQDGLIGLYATSVALATSDVVFSCIPIIFIRTLRRPLSEKIMLVCLMGLGLFASAAAIPKILFLKYYGAPGDPYWDIARLSVWSLVEQNIGLIAACTPCMKSPVQRFLQRIGALSSEKGPGVNFSSFVNSADRSNVRVISLCGSKLRHTEEERGATVQSEEHMLSSDSNSQQWLADVERAHNVKDTDATVSVIHIADSGPLGTWR